MSKMNDAVNAMIVPTLSTVEGRTDALEALSNAIAAVIAVSVNGDQRAAEEMLMGTEGYIQGCLADKLRMIRAMRR